MQTFKRKSSLVAFAVAAAFAGSVSAVNLPNGGGLSPAYAKERLNPFSTPFSIAADGAYTSSTLNITGGIGFGASFNQSLYLRFDVSSGQFAQTGTLTVAGVPAANITLVQGGAGSNFEIWQVTADVPGFPVNAATSLTFANGNFLNNVPNTNNPVIANYRLYGDAVSAAQGNANTLYGASGHWVDFANSVSPGVFVANSNPNPILADAVGNNAKSFVLNTPTVTATTAQLGYFSINAPVTANEITGAQITLADLMYQYYIYVQGDFSAALTVNPGTGPVSGSVGYGPNADCSGLTPFNFWIQSDSALTFFNPAIAQGPTYICYTVNGVSRINASSYSATWQPFANSGWAQQPASNGTLDPIALNAVSLQSPYFSGSSFNTARVVLLNTSSSPVPYSLTAVLESGNSCSPGTASGTLAPNSQTIIPVTDVCSSYTGNTRGAIQAFVQGPNSSIQGSVWTVNNATTVTTTVDMMRPGTN